MYKNIYIYIYIFVCVGTWSTYIYIYIYHICCVQLAPSKHIGWRIR